MIPIQEMQQQQQQQLHTMHPIKPREKMVTFEDDPKCPHGLPATPRKTLPISNVGDVFM